MKQPKIKNFSIAFSAQVGRKRIEAFAQQNKNTLYATIKINGNIVFEEKVIGEAAIQAFLHERFIENMDEPLKGLLINSNSTNKA